MGIKEVNPSYLKGIIDGYQHSFIKKVVVNDHLSLFVKHWNFLLFKDQFNNYFNSKCC